MNTSSLVIKMKYGNTTFLFMGDANKIVEDILLKRYTSVEIRANVLKTSKP